MSTNAKRDIFHQLGPHRQALSSPTRIEFLELLQEERNVEQLAGLTGATVPNTSRHLQKLRQAGLIVGRKEGQYVFLPARRGTRWSGCSRLLARWEKRISRRLSASSGYT